MSQAHFVSAASSTADPPQGVPLYLRRDEDAYIVTDVIGTRYGWGETPAVALAEWADQVNDILDIPNDKLGDPILTEVARYRQALQPAV